MKPFVKAPVCRHFNSCSGCQLDLQEAIPPIWEEISSHSARIWHCSPSFEQGSVVKWRHRAKLAIRGTAENPLIGLFAEKSHEVIPIPFCQVHHPSINQAALWIRRFIQKRHLKPYDETNGQGDIRYVQFVVEKRTGAVQMSLVLNFNDPEDFRCRQTIQLLKELGEQEGHRFWHSVWINLNAERTNTIFGNQWIKCWGEEFLWETFGSTSICYQPANFAQANLTLFERLLGDMSGWINQGARIAEFYAGVGVIGFFLAPKCEWARCAEMNPNSKECFDHSKNRLSEADGKKISFYTGAAHQLLSILKEASVIIVDPPRKGLDKELLAAFESASAQQLIYMSCGWPSFKKDCAELLEKGWELKELKGYLFFPGSRHVELLANFKRKA